MRAAAELWPAPMQSCTPTILLSILVLATQPTTDNRRGHRNLNKG
jgi:hypothetical protein